VKYTFPSVDMSFSKDWEKEYCKKGYSWKISFSSDEGNLKISDENNLLTGMNG
jgi:hypothetical protein